jgi:hypothetical protein
MVQAVGEKPETQLETEISNLLKQWMNLTSVERCQRRESAAAEGMAKSKIQTMI